MGYFGQLICIISKIIIPNKINYFPSFLKSATGMLKRMRDNINISEEHYKPLYYALFKSHVTYCITFFGKVSKACSEKLFKIEKHVKLVYVHAHLKHRDWEFNLFAKNIPNRFLTRNIGFSKFV